MDVAGLAIAVFNEVFEICRFITQTITDAAHHDKDFSKLEFEFTHQQNILGTFGKRFIEGKIIYELEDCLILDFKRILEELRKIVGEYARLAAKYNNNYKKLVKNMAEWWKSGGSQKKADREGLRLDAASTHEPPKKSLGFRHRLSRKLTQLEWALFDRKKLEELVKDQRDWTRTFVDIIKLTLLQLPRFSNDVSQLQELVRDAKTLGFSKLAKTRLLILAPSQGYRN